MIRLYLITFLTIFAMHHHMPENVWWTASSLMLFVPLGVSIYKNRERYSRN